MNDKTRLNRAPQDETWPGERVVIWSYSDKPTLDQILKSLRGEGEFGADEVVVTDLGDAPHDTFIAVANGLAAVETLAFRRVDGVAVLDLPADFARVHPLALRKLLWLLPQDSIYLAIHESVDPRGPFV